MNFLKNLNYLLCCTSAKNKYDFDKVNEDGLSTTTNETETAFESTNEAFNNNFNIMHVYNF